MAFPQQIASTIRTLSPLKLSPLVLLCHYCRTIGVRAERGDADLLCYNKVSQAGNFVTRINSGACRPPPARARTVNTGGERKKKIDEQLFAHVVGRALLQVTPSKMGGKSHATTRPLDNENKMGVKLGKGRGRKVGARTSVVECDTEIVSRLLGCNLRRVSLLACFSRVATGTAWQRRRRRPGARDRAVLRSPASSQQRPGGLGTAWARGRP